MILRLYECLRKKYSAESTFLLYSFFGEIIEKSRIQETRILSTNEDRSTDTKKTCWSAVEVLLKCQQPQSHNFPC